jgi:hypothetical protein
MSNATNNIFNLDSTNVSQSLIDILGLNPKENLSILGNTNTYLPNVGIITPTSSLGVQINTYQNEIISTNNTNIYSFIIPVDVSLSSLISYRPNQYFPQSAKIRNTYEYIDKLDIKVYDTVDNSLFESSTDWEMLLKIE